jgi:NAD-dependent deacetylase
MIEAEQTVYDYRQMETSDGTVSELVSRAAGDLVKSTYAIALTGAGISTESGIPDYRGPSGLWTRDPAAERRAYQSYDRFLEDPASWWKETMERHGQGLGNLWEMKPNAGHLALVDLEKSGRLRCVITQNVDALHEKAGSGRVLEYHGSFMKLRCISCGARFYREEFDLEKMRRENELPPRCNRCKGILKSDAVAFGEPIPADVAGESLEEVAQCDLMLVCGTSALVYPFASLPAVARERSGVTIIEVNAEPTPLTRNGISDYFIRGKTGAVLPAIVREVQELMGRPSGQQS